MWQRWTEGKRGTLRLQRAVEMHQQSYLQSSAEPEADSEKAHHRCGTVPRRTWERRQRFQYHILRHRSPPSCCPNISKGK